MANYFSGWIIVFFCILLEFIWKSSIKKITSDIYESVFYRLLVFKNPVIGILPKVQIKTIVYLVVVC